MKWTNFHEKDDFTKWLYNKHTYYRSNLALTRTHRCTELGQVPLLFQQSENYFIN